MQTFVAGVCRSPSDRRVLDPLVPCGVVSLGGRIFERSVLMLTTGGKRPQFGIDSVCGVQCAVRSSSIDADVTRAPNAKRVCACVHSIRRDTFFLSVMLAALIARQSVRAYCSSARTRCTAHCFTCDCESGGSFVECRAVPASIPPVLCACVCVVLRFRKVF